MSRELLKIKKLRPDAIAPSYAHDNDSGLDLHSIESLEIAPGESVLIHTGIAIALPPRTEAQIRPRSGLALRSKITVLNSPSTIDEGYRGEIMVILINHGNEAFWVSVGDRIAQMVIAPVIRVDLQEVEAIDETARGANGFGSTGF